MLVVSGRISIRKNDLVARQVAFPKCGVNAGFLWASVDSWPSRRKWVQDSQGLSSVFGVVILKHICRDVCLPVSTEPIVIAVCRAKSFVNDGTWTTTRRRTHLSLRWNAFHVETILSTRRSTTWCGALFDRTQTLYVFQRNATHRRRIIHVRAVGVVAVLDRVERFSL